MDYEDFEQEASGKQSSSILSLFKNETQWTFIKLIRENCGFIESDKWH